MSKWFAIIFKKLITFCILFIVLTISSCSKVSEISSEEIISYSQTSRIRGLDPAVSGEVSSSLAISKIYEGLLQYDYLARPYKVIPLLAESMPTISENGLIYTFKIRKGIYFEDDDCFENGLKGKGRELVAEDFIYSIKRVADVKNSS